ncbi:MAG TPA: DUF1326 domain-containing protein [Candidatus Limnocylindrales bacterium]|nr:DUF1326 domain-containing protein [Candidatus Limnocylindrales bacterium]
MLSRLRVLSALAVGILLLCGAVLLGADAPKSASTWAMSATIIEACSCPMFCQCYFDTKPAMAMATGANGMEMQHYCRFNNAFQVNKGTYGATKLDGAKFWVAGDLGPEFSGGKMDWAVVTFDPSVTPAQREGIEQIMGHVYPVKWNSFTVGTDAPIEWHYTRDAATAKMDGGKVAEVELKRFAGNTEAPVVIHNLKYWGTKRNNGFVLMPNTVEAYHLGDKAFEYKGTNGFMITFDINNKDIASAN